MKEKIMGFINKHQEIWKFIKFLFTGLSTSILELAVYAFLHYVVFISIWETPVKDNPILEFLGIEYAGYMWSYLISATIGYAAAYIMNRKITFKADANPVLSTILYAIMVVGTIAFNTWFGGFIGTFLTKNGWNNIVWLDLIVKFLLMQLPVVWTYPLNRFVIHRKKKPEAE